MWPPAVSTTSMRWGDVRVGQDAPDDAGRNDQVVAGPVAQRAELALEHARAFVDEDHFVAVRVAVPVVHRLLRPDDRDADVLFPISGTRPSTASPPGGELGRAEEAMPDRALRRVRSS